ncbi:MAG TPA: bile acid:sodium symporter family protein [Sphingobium sp.]|nr:bile acid:sodium symporter family protein [Sphingobium sp.]
MNTSKAPDRRISLAMFMPDYFTLALVGTVVLASLLPARGAFVPMVDLIGHGSIILLFFLHGANLPREAVMRSFGEWKLHSTVLSSTFILFPLIGIALAPLSGRVIDPSLYVGILFLCCLPSTVQSSIAFTSIAHGNVPAAICAASASNLLGIVVTPLLTGLLLASQSAISLEAIWSIVGTILLPFAAGQMLHGRLSNWLARRKPVLKFVDRGSVLIMVYAAFGNAVTHGIWQTISVGELGLLILLSLAILGLVILILRSVSRRLGFSAADEAAVIFCGSKKSLITGVPMASILFPASAVGAIILPLMTFHQIQLIVCAFIARSYERRAEETAGHIEVAHLGG